MIRPAGSATDRQARQLLRSFRDLNLGPCGIDVGKGSRVLVVGCLSVDAPVERGVRYSVRDSAGVERLLEIYCNETNLDIQLSSATTENARVALGVQLATDGLGRLSAPELGARLRLRNSNTRTVEHFLRRIVRAAFAQAG
ncbi:MAG: hypothetical protein ABGY71_08995 [bacterium]|jgi:hypothetical protein|nr:hypothetical protein [Planctomycetota bacterium]